ncbi:MAG: phosphoenolpyruvate synthase [Dehalococcoidia bacterium]
MSESNAKYIRWFRDISLDDVSLVGGKTASLGEMFRELTAEGVRVPNGFAITAEAYRDMLNASGASQRLGQLLEGLDTGNLSDLQHRAKKARALIYEAGLPPQLSQEILEAYRSLQQEYGADVSLAVRSSATAEDLPTASFAGQQETYLNVKGDDELIDACRRCFASLFTDRAIAYRVEHGFDHLDVALSIAVMKMVRSDLAASGVMFSLDTESGHRDVVFITAAYGLGENVVQGTVDPDEFYVHKPTYKQGYRAVLRRSVGEKQWRMVYADGSEGDGHTVMNVPTSPEERRRFCITDEEVLELAGAAITIEEHYSRRAGVPRPMDMEWAKDGIDGLLYVIQARPETVASQKTANELETYELKGTGTVVVSGRAVGSNIASGKARVIKSAAELSRFKPGEVLVADTTTPDWGPVMKTAAALVTNRGGRTCHAAIVARELGIPAVVGAEGATEKIKDGAEVTISCAEGDVGRVYEGDIPFVVNKIDLSQLGRPKTKIMVNVGNPEIAFKSAMIPNDGVGLARMEFIIGEHIKAHPMALLHPERVEDATERAEVEALLCNHADAASFFVEKLSEGVGTIAAAFYPKPVVVRMSDFKTNEYASMLGGRWFELPEANPMLGFRGAARYTHPSFSEAFALECAAMRRVRNEMGLKNVVLMLPFCRRVEEAEKVLELMARHGLRRGEDGLKIYVMAEIPNNIIQIDEFAKLFDGFSIGSNDLTQLVLGVDRDSEILAAEFDERDPGVLKMIQMAVEGAKRNHRYSGICGQAPSDYPEVAEFLVRIGIESMSLSPDTVIQTTQAVLELEGKLGR